VEEHFYLFLPLILIFLQFTKLTKKSYWLLIILFLLGFAIRTYSFINFYLPKVDDESSWMYWYKYIYYPTYNRLDGLLVGVSIAGIYQFLPTVWSKLSKFGNQTIILGLFILIGAYFLCEDQQTFNASIFGFTLVAIGYGFMVVGAISPTSFLYKWNSKGMTFIATLSYAIYLTHRQRINISNIFTSNHLIMLSHMTFFSTFNIS